MWFKAFSNFKQFYNEINAATLTGAIDVIVVEQPDGTFLCSPFHVRFGKLGVLRSREKIVDIEINDTQVDIHMKLGESGEAFFVEECPEDDLEQLPENMATSPIPTSQYSKYVDDDGSLNSPGCSGVQTVTVNVNDVLPMPRRNSIDLSKESTAANATEGSNGDKNKYENQVSDFTKRRHTDTDSMDRRDLSASRIEYTTQKIRQEWAVHEENIFPMEHTSKTNVNKSNEDKFIRDSVFRPIVTESSTPILAEAKKEEKPLDDLLAVNSGESKSKKKRRKKSAAMKKKQNVQRKNSTSSSGGSLQSDVIDPTQDLTATSNAATGGSSSTDESPPPSTVVPTHIVSSPETAKIGESIEVESQSTIKEQDDSNARRRELDIHFFSDTELNSAMSPQGSRPTTPVQSDTEFEMSQRDKSDDNSIMTNSASWKWGELPTHLAEETKEPISNDEKQAQRNSRISTMIASFKSNKLRKSAPEGLYLSDLDAEGMDPEIAALYFPQISVKDKQEREKERDERNEKHNNGKRGSNGSGNEEDRESGNGTSVPHSPNSLEGPKSIDSDYEENKFSDVFKLLDIGLSLCGGLEYGGEPTDEEFRRHILTYEDLCHDPKLFMSPKLVVRTHGQYLNFMMAFPVITTYLAFNKNLPKEALDKLLKETTTNGLPTTTSGSTSPTQQGGQQQETKHRGYSWWSWGRSGGNSVGTDKSEQQQQQPTAVVQPTIKTTTFKETTINVTDIDNIKRSTSSTLIIETEQSAVGTQTSRANTPEKSEDDLTATITNKMNDLSVSSEESEINKNLINNSFNNDVNTNNIYNHCGEKFRKTLRLSSDQIKKLNLNYGANEIVFSVTTAYQGTTRCKCYLFRWKYNDKVVISDIDGTITRSDVLGHILPMVGKDWAQIGVAQLFTKIEENGYKLLYLSARAIGQSRTTRDYLRSIRQGDVNLPIGPLLLNPTSLISAFHREVIEKKPEQFKIACLSDIQALFPKKNPFYAGYGNRVNDVFAYRTVGIPIRRIFTINTKGELKHELTQTFQSSYCSMAYIVDQLFPPVCDDVEATADEYSNFNYWRDPVPDLSLFDEIDGGLSNEIAAAATSAAISSGNGATSIGGAAAVAGTTVANTTNESNTIDILSNNIALASMQVTSKPLTAIPEN